jgi:hypothetical protein
MTTDYQVETESPPDFTNAGSRVALVAVHAPTD